MPNSPEDSERPRGDANQEQKPTVHPRIARARLLDVLDLQAHLTFARRALVRLNRDTEGIDAMLVQARGLQDRYTMLAEGRMEGRRKPVQRSWNEEDGPRKQYLLCLDECGSHEIHPRGDAFPAFGLCGVIVDDERYLAFDRDWQRWKTRHLRSPRTIVHEPEVRRREHHFYRSDPDEQRRLIEALEAQLAGMDFVVIAAVVQKLDFVALHGHEPVDDYLPRSQYLMCLDFVIERFVHFLYYAGGDARGIVYAESRGALEDALVQQEYVRLRIEGTQFQSASWFRYQLAPFIEFVPKHRNHSGLQIADLAARPCAAKVLAPIAVPEPERWSVVRAKLYDGLAGRPESYGLKSFPASSAGPIFGRQGPATSRRGQANGDAFAPPLTD